MLNWTVEICMIQDKIAGKLAKLLNLESRIPKCKDATSPRKVVGVCGGGCKEWYSESWGE